MLNRLLVLMMLSGSLCLGQSTLVTPSTDDSRADQNTGDSGNAQLPGTQTRTMGPETLTPGRQPATEMPVQPWMRPRIVGPLRTKSEFQKYAEDATGRKLPVFGRQVFDQVPSTFAPIDNTPVPADYVVGPGDQLLIRIWGKIELDSRFTVDRNGEISLPRVGTLTVAGLHYAQLNAYLRAAVGKLFRDFDLNVTLGHLRSIQVFVLGDARQPGTYTVSALSTLVDALFTSGGPSASGSMRRIELRREGHATGEFDLYDLLVRGDKSHDVRLLPGDVIFIHPVGRQVAISGDINRPGIYELKGETSVGDALAIAGGITSLANTERAVLERTDEHRGREVNEFSLDAEGSKRLLQDGDLLRIFPLSPKFSNAVTLRGNVADPGLYPWHQGMRVSDLIPSRDALITRTYWNRQNHLVQPLPEQAFAVRARRAASDQLPKLAGSQTQPRNSGQYVRRNQENQENNDDRDYYQGDDQTDTSYNDYGDQSMNDPDLVAPDPTQQFNRQPTAEREPQSGPNAQNADTWGGTDSKQDGYTTSRAIASIGKNSAEVNWEYALIERLDEHDLSTRLIPFRLASAVDNPSSADNRELKPGDVVTVFSRADLELPMEKHASFVRVGGEVNAPGVYRIDPGETLRDVVEKAGGLTDHSYLYASVFTRVSARKAEEVQLQQSADQMQHELVSRFAAAPPQTGQTTGTEQQAQFALMQQAISQLTAIRPTGRVVLAMKPDASGLADIPAIPLEDGDSLYIPPRLSTVQVAGAVYNANAFRYETGQRLVDYLNASGGPTRDADSKRMFVIRADGTVISRQSRNLHSHGKYENLKLLPGDAIVVPEKLRISSKAAEWAIVSQLASSAALTAAAISVVR